MSTGGYRVCVCVVCLCVYVGGCVGVDVCVCGCVDVCAVPVCVHSSGIWLIVL